MTEVIGGRGAEPPARYVEQPAPYRRNQKEKDRWRDVERENKLISRALEDIQRGPPSAYHAPMGYDSIKGAAPVKAKDDTQTQPPPVWPPPRNESGQILRSRRQAEIDQANCKMTKKLVEQYTSLRPRSAQNPGGLYRPDNWQPPNYLTTWAMRTALYLPTQPPTTSPYATAVDTAASIQHSSIAPGTSPFPSQQQRTTPLAGGGVVEVGGPTPPPKPQLRRPRTAADRVPKTLGVAKCSGCGVQAFRKADGVHLQPCRHCKQVWYCSEVCAKSDWLSHKSLCKWKTTGHWEPFGRKQEEESWVSNGACAEVRRELERRGAAAVSHQASNSPANVLLAKALAGGAMVQNNLTPTFADTNPRKNALQTNTMGVAASSGVEGESGGGALRDKGALWETQPVTVSVATGAIRAGSGKGWIGIQASPEGAAACGGGHVRASRVGTAIGYMEVNDMHAQLDEADEVEALYQRARDKELEWDRRQKLIEKRADQGLDGPRPCMYAGGKRI